MSGQRAAALSAALRAAASFRALSLYLRLVKKPALARMRSEADMRRGMQRSGDRIDQMTRGWPDAALATRRLRLPDPEGSAAVSERAAPLDPAAPYADRGGAAPSLLWTEPADPRPGPTASPPVALYLHGGAFAAGSPQTHLSILRRLAARLGGPVAALDYRLAPEHPFPAALDDAVSAYRWLLSRDAGGPGIDPARLVLAGDSAGGGLAAALLVDLERRGLPAPAAAALFSPFADLTLSGDSLTRLARREALLPTGRIAEVVAAYVGDADPADPRLSPVFARFERPPPPTFIQVGAYEALRDDATRLAETFRRAGGAVRLEIAPHAPHGVQLLAPILPAARALLDRGADFLRAAAAPR